MSDVWLRVPDPDSPEAIGWPLAVAAQVEAEEDRIPFARALADTLVRYSIDPGDRRVALVLVDDPPLDVRAWAVADLLDRDTEDAQAAADAWVAAWRFPPDGRVRAWSRTVESATVEGDPARVAHDLLADTATGEVEHRVVIARFPRETLATVRLTVTTSRIGAVPDLPRVALALARLISPVPEGVP